MPAPQLGDVILRRGANGTVIVVDAITDKQIAGPVQLRRAIQLARAHGAAAIWQQHVDERGRPLGDVSRIPLS
jgi:hypothetical protein